MPIVNRLPINLTNDDQHHKALIERQTKSYMKHDTSRDYTCIPIGSTVAVH